MSVRRYEAHQSTTVGFYRPFSGNGLPHGSHPGPSFGLAIEEAHAGMRCILESCGTADKAVALRREHPWY
jgi:hypothetical protein